MKSTAVFKQMKGRQEPITMITAYDAPAGKAAEKAGMDMILVGDSAGMVVHGYDSTIPVTLDDMVMHARAVRRGAPGTFIVVDLPFLTYHSSVESTFTAVRRLMQEGGAQAVKLEGGDEVTRETIARLTAAGVPTVGHIGLTPQSVGVLGGYKVQGKTKEEAQRLMEEAEGIEQAGAFALVLECVPGELAARIAAHLSIPVIGIGAGAGIDGQVLVFHDAVGWGDSFVPSFAKQYTNVQAQIDEALENYVSDVKARAFPEDRHTFSMDASVLNDLSRGASS